MSIEPQALERSVLEGKEREELAAIAGAMGAKPGPRASKATLIGHILREAGIEDDKPKRTRATKAAAAPAESSNGEAAPAEAKPAPEAAAPAPAETTAVAEATSPPA